MAYEITSGSATILNGATTSSAINCFISELLGVRIPSAFTGATITITESETESGTYNTVYNISGGALSFPVSTSRTILFTPSDLAGLKYIKLVSGSSEGADRTIGLILRDI